MSEEKETSWAECLEPETSVRLPRMWRVVLLNDDYTTMDFVMRLLVTLFGKNTGEAEALTIAVHKEGRGVAGVYVRDIAESLAKCAEDMARSAGFPLRCVAEEDQN